MARNVVVGAGLILYNFTNKNVRILIVKSSISGKWGFPKGHKENYERDLKDTAIREMKEETGIDVYKSRLDSKGFKLGDYVYWNVKHDRLEKVDMQKSEIKEYLWISIEDLLKFKDSECNYGLKFFKNRQNDNRFRSFINKHYTSILV